MQHCAQPHSERDFASLRLYAGYAKHQGAQPAGETVSQNGHKTRLLRYHAVYFRKMPLFATMSLFLMMAVLSLPTVQASLALVLVPGSDLLS